MLVQAANIFPQTTDLSVVRDMITDMYEQYAGETEDYSEAETFNDDLMQLYAHPVNLNNCSREDLEKIVFLSDKQIEEILYYVYKRRKMTDLYELQLVEGLDMTDIRRILPFVTLGEPDLSGEKITPADLLKYGKKELYTQFDRTIETKAGYLTDPKSGKRDYAGSAWHHSLKFRYQYHDSWLGSLTAEKDAGEQSYRYDSFGMSVMKKGRGLVKTFIAGDYQASFGQGLLINQGFRRGKQADTGNTFARSQGFKRFASVNEYNFFRGIAFSLQQKALTLDAFASYRVLDADTTGQKFSSVYKTGYHRTDNEIRKKHSLQQFVSGIHLKYKHDRFETGVSTYHTLFHLPLEQTGYPYQYFQFSGRQQNGISIHYRTVYRIFQLYGEVALTAKDAMALLQGCTFSPADAVELTAIYRNYSPRYNGILASAFGEGSKVNNEEGMYLGGVWQPAYGWKTNFYADFYRFPWIRYNADTPGFGKDFQFGFQYQPHADFQISGRLKTEESVETLHQQGYLTEQPIRAGRISLKGNSTYRAGLLEISNGIVLQYTEKEGVGSSGFAIYQGVDYKHDSGRYRIGGRITFFDAVNYDNRIYLYEDDILHAFSVPMLSGRGSRMYVNLQYKFPGEIFSVWMKYAWTKYADDRKEISSGNEMIAGNTKSDIRLLMRVVLK